MGKPIALLVLAVFISGCATPTSFLHTMKDNPNLTSEEMQAKLGKPKQIIKINSNVSYYSYKFNCCRAAYQPYAAYFVDDKIYSYGADNTRLHLETKHSLGLINEDEYRWRYEQILKEEAIQAQMNANNNAMSIQMVSNMQNFMLQQQQQNLGTTQEAESIQSSVQVIGTRPSYRINNGYVYPVDDSIHIVGNEKK